MKVYIVNMGIGGNVEQRKAMRVFTDKNKAIDWIIKHFQECVQYLEEQKRKDTLQYGFNIGNSFHLYEMDIEDEIYFIFMKWIENN